MRWFVLLFFAIPSANAGSITPSFTTGQMESSSSTKPQWEVKTPGEAFSITENFLAPGLDAVSTIQRTINTESQSTSLSIFSQ